MEAPTMKSMDNKVLPLPLLPIADQPLPVGMSQNAWRSSLEKASSGKRRKYVPGSIYASADDFKYSIKESRGGGRREILVDIEGLIPRW